MERPGRHHDRVASPAALRRAFTTLRRHHHARQSEPSARRLHHRRTERLSLLTIPPRTRTAAAITFAVALLGTGCAQRTDLPVRLDGVYRLSTTSNELARIDAPGESVQNWGDWTLVLTRDRFAITQQNPRACTWSYGALRRDAHNGMSWTVIDGGAVPTRADSDQPGDAYTFRWSSYRDVLTLHTINSGAGRYYTVKPWRRIGGAASAKALSARCPPPAEALQPTGAEHAVPGIGVALDFRANLTRTGPRTWEGNGTAAGLGRGHLTIRGPVALIPAQTRNRLTFTARFRAGELRGCAIETFSRRPNGRYLWGSDTGAQVTAATSSLRDYIGLAVHVDGLTRTSALTHTYIHLLPARDAERRRSPAAAGDLC